MTHPKDLSIQSYTYALPEERIATYPLAERDQSRLLIWKNGEIREDIYRRLARHIPEDSFLVFNNTRVVEARLLFQKPTGGIIEVFCLEPHEQYADISSAMLQKGKVYWHCLVGGASKWKPGQVLEKMIGDIRLSARFTEKRTGSFVIELSWSDPERSFAEILHLAGAIPLPPYIKREAERSDKERYQTVYARQDGSVAAPTAGLHFTDHIFNELDKIHVVKGFVTLHVGAGTFKPVKSGTLEGHDMHAEWIEVSRDFIQSLLRELEESIIAVGTTSLRTLESLYWLGVKARQLPPENRDHEVLRVGQWDPYELAHEAVSPADALLALLKWMEEHQLDRLVTKTRLLIAPGYRFQFVDGLITNFHQPQSTLLLLVAALVGEDWRKIYDYALEKDFRFLSYGDGSLLWRKP